jgi:DNA-binding phage protein
VKEFIRIIRQAMHIKNIKISQLSTKTKISEPHLYNLLNGNKRWNSDTLFLVCNALDIKIKFEIVPEAS